MPTTHERKQQKDIEQHQREALSAVIGEQVIHTLGKSNELRRVDVRQLWEDHFRVNVLIGADASCAKIANSYFVGADGNGNIVESRPKITKQY